MSQRKTEPKKGKIRESVLKNEQISIFLVKTNNMVLCLIFKEIMSVFKYCNLQMCYMQKCAAKFYAYQGMFPIAKTAELRNNFC